MPSGTVTFCFTDIEGSSVRWDRDRAAMESAVRRHDAILRAAIVAHDGTVFKTIGDAFCAVFPRAVSALAACSAFQCRLALEDFSAVDGIRVRVALHTGTADERDDDYFGPAVNRVARLLAIAWGEQIVMSRVTATLARDSLGPGLSLFDLGEHRLKDLSEPERVFQLNGPGLRESFPPLRSLRDVPGNLPEAATSFVGREHETREVAEMLAAGRLVTIVGPGGIGKTRLALATASAARERFPDGAWIVDLAAVASSGPAITAFATPFGIALPPEGDALSAVVEGLRTKRALLLADNCEHVIEPIARLCSALLREAPGVQIVATSRQRLGIAGERVYHLHGLSVPSEAQLRDLDSENATTFGAIALFFERAHAIDGRFSLTAAAARIVAQIVRRLDGIALAIELAVPRLKMLGLERLRDRLDERFRLLTGGRRDALPHHQTLRATLDWSYDLLDEREQTLFRRSSVFVDSFSIEALTPVAAIDGLDEFEIFDVLGSLVDKSLIATRPDADHGQPRYAMLETTHAYARARLEEAAEDVAHRELHARHFAGAMERAGAEREERGRSDLLIDLQADLDNCRAAFEWSLENDPAPAVAILAAGRSRFWERAGLCSEGIERSHRLLDRLAPDDHRARARVLLVTPVLFSTHGLLEKAFAAARLAIEEARLTTDLTLTLTTSLVFANSATLTHRFDEAREALDAAKLATDTLRSDVLTLRYLGARMLYATMCGDLETAMTTSLEEIRLARHMGETHSELIATANLAEVEHARGNTERAVHLVGDAIARGETLLGRERLGHTFSNLAGYLNALDRHAEALAAVRAATDLLDDASLGNPSLVWPLEQAALAHVMEGRAEIAATLVAFCDAALAAHDYRREPAEEAVRSRILETIAEIDDGERERCFARGRALAPLDAIALATSVGLGD